MAFRILIRKPISCFSVPFVNPQNRIQLRKCSVDLSGSSDIKQESEVRAENPVTTGHWTLCINEVRLLGFMGADPKQYDNGKNTFIFFPMATHNYFKLNTGETIKSTVWHKILVKGSALKTFSSDLFTKGSRIFVSGFLTNRRLNLNDDEYEFPVTVVQVDKIILLRKSRSEIPGNDDM